MIKRILCLVVAVLVVISTCAATVSAAGRTIKVDIKRYNSGTAKYESAEYATNGDLILVTVYTDSTFRSVSLLNFRLAYNSDFVTYVDASAQSHLVAGNPNAGSPLFTNRVDSANPANSYIVCYIGANSTEDAKVASNVTGTMVTFVFSCKAMQGTASFEMQIKEFYDGTFNSIALSSTTASASIPIQSWEFSKKAEFEKLLDITYPDSKSDIEAADEVYKAMDSADVMRFKNSYPDLFSVYSNAWQKYYALANQAAETAVKKEADDYLAEYSDVIALQSSEVNAKNYQNVSAAYKAFENLSAQAKQRIPGATATHLKELNVAAKQVKEKLAAQQLADEIVSDFTANPQYKLLLDLSDEMIADSYEDLEALAAEAMAVLEEMDTENMSPAALKQYNNYVSRIQHVLSVIKSTIADNEKERKVLDEIAAFTNQWLYVLKLNSLNVSIGDKLAIQMMLEAYEKLSDDAQSRLASSKNTAESLLQQIGNLQNLPSSNSTGTVVVPGSQQTGSSQNLPSSNSTGTVVLPGSQQTTTSQTGSQSGNTGENSLTAQTIVKDKLVARETPLFVRIMLLLAACSSSFMFVPVSVYMIWKQKQNRRIEEGDFE